ncbi:gfo/Idh/MocA family oxidoreductase [Ornithinibacillus sp. L9]|uniref:Gfo/Idh/MocA family oxidoreductase n=1 Tax=Ornithinibacillus caprae TaxID=2678566 RepID=A0A6N8FML2_9BACI|nr:Gfo/Idh/MocA family oxidoreductase [Ornithinibacillus caprae]MUK88578.1 gfo/Idh/MocA family oxidoreductase [Ornithinibacillus caprae]
MKQVNVGIIGLGAIGERLLKQFDTHPSTTITAISDVNVKRMEEMEELLTDVASYQDYHNLIADDSVDLVYVAVPPKFHHQISLEALYAGKHVLCEKPLANSYQEAKEMRDKAKSAGVVNAINFPLPYSNTVESLVEHIDNGKIGTLKRIELTMQFPEWPRSWQQNEWIAGREQGGFIREITPHFIQLTHQLFGKVRNIQSYVDYPENTEACETGVIARMELQDGTPIVINGISGIGKKEELAYRLYGDQGVLSLLNWGQLTYSTMQEDDIRISERDAKHPGLIDELVKAISGKSAKLVTFEDGFAVQQVLEDLLENTGE